MKGVNIGGWLAIENWMTLPTRESIERCNISVSVVGQSLYIHLFFTDEGHTKGDVQFKNHRDTFLTEHDYSDIAVANMDTVRIVSFLLFYWDNWMFIDEWSLAALGSANFDNDAGGGWTFWTWKFYNDDRSSRNGSSMKVIDHLI
jgi:hypothetical protein